jgi:hypothetical protein
MPLAREKAKTHDYEDSGDYGADVDEDIDGTINASLSYNPAI